MVNTCLWMMRNLADAASCKLATNLISAVALDHAPDDPRECQPTDPGVER